MTDTTQIEQKIIDTLLALSRPAAFEELLEHTEIDEAELKEGIEALLTRGEALFTRKRRLALPAQLGLSLGRVQGHARGYGFFIPQNGGEDLFIPPDNLNGAMHNDRVWVREAGRSPRGAREAEVAFIAARANTRVVGVFHSDGLGAYVVPNEARLGHDVFIPQNAQKGAKAQDAVVAEITAYPDGVRPLEGKVVEVLGNKYAPGTDMLSIIRKFDLPDEFPKNALKLAKELNAPVEESALMNREDWRDRLIITIDGADAKDLDDAVSLTRLANGNFELGVHIADVSHYILENGALDKEAQKRGTSVYFPDRVLPMFPPDISNGVCSLNEKTVKLTLSCIMELDVSGGVISYRVAETAIKTARRMTYEAVNAMFDGDEAFLKEYEDVAPMLTDMRALMHTLFERRMKRGSIDFDLNEAKIELDPTGRTVNVALYERGEANRMIEEFMLLANETVARHVNDLHLPFMYRVHEKPDGEKLTSFAEFIETLGYGFKSYGGVQPKHYQALLRQVKGTPEEGVVNRVALRSLKKAHYSEESLGHFGLAAEFYCHFTSPIRRYPDLMVHRVLKDALHRSMNKRRQSKYEAAMPALAQHCSEREIAAVEAERAADNLKKCEYMQSRIGAVETGIISGVTQYGFYVELPNTIEGMVRLTSLEGDRYVCDEKNYRIVGKSGGKTFRLGDAARIRVAGVDMENALIAFELYDARSDAKALTKKPLKQRGKNVTKITEEKGPARSKRTASKDKETTGSKKRYAHRKPRKGAKPGVEKKPKA